MDSDSFPDNLTIILVGAPEAGYEFFSKINSDSTIGNRISITHQISGLDLQQIKIFLEKGFNEKLKMNLIKENINIITEYIKSMLDGLPQYIHEFCILFSKNSNSSNPLKNNLNKTINDWIKGSEDSIYYEIRNAMNSRNTDGQRRNQVLYSLGFSNKWIFSIKDIEKILKNEFPSTREININVSQMLGQLKKSSIIKDSATNKGS